MTSLVTSSLYLQTLNRFVGSLLSVTLRLLPKVPCPSSDRLTTLPDNSHAHMPPQKKQLGPCKQQACDIQACISKNNYQEKHCLAEIAALVACCDQQAADEKPVHCAFNQRYRRLLAEAGANSQGA